MLKRFLIGLVSIVIAAATASCGGEEPIGPVIPDPPLIDTTITVLAKGGTNYVAITSRSAWKATVKSGAAWCSISPSEGDMGNAIITIKTEASDDFSERQAFVEFCNETATGRITIIQQQVDLLDVEMDGNCEFGPQGGTFGVNVSHNVEYEISVSADWVHPTQTKAVQNDAFMFEVDANYSGEDRTCDVSIDGGGQNTTITVSQVAAYLRLTENEVLLDATDGVLPVIIESNVPFEVMEASEDWFVLPVETSSPYDISLHANEGWFIREGTVVFFSEEFDLSSSLLIVQKAADIMSASVPLFEFGPEGGSFEFDVDPTQEYKFSFEDADWISVTIPDDSPNRRVITVDKSLSAEARTATVTITRGEAEKSLDFSQPGTAPEMSATEFLFATEGGSQLLTVAGSLDYDLVMPDDCRWCSVLIHGDGEYTVSVEANDTEAPRTCSFSFVNEEYEVNMTVVVSQAQKDAFWVTPTEFVLGPEGGGVQVGVHANIEYSYDIDAAGWIADVEDDQTDELLFAVGPNNSGEARHCHLLFTANGFEATVTIDQQAAFMEASEQSFYVTSKPSEHSFAVTANVPFLTKVTDATWLTITDVSSENVSFSLEENESREGRQCEIIVYNEECAVSDTVSVVQKAHDFLDIEQTEFDLPPQGGSVSVEVSTNNEYQYHIEGSPDWISEVSPLEFKIDINTGEDAREGQIVFEQDGNSTIVSISQDAPVLTVSPESFDFGEDGGEGSFSVVSNIDFSISQPSEEWARCSADGVSSYTVEVSPNDIPEIRRCTIEISSAEFFRTVSIELTQAQMLFFELLTDSFSFGPEGGDFTVEVSTNMDYVASPGADWVAGEGLGFTVDRNLTGEARSCTVDFSARDIVYPVTVTQEAAFLEVDKSRIELPADGGEVCFVVSSNVDYEVSLPEEEWITCTVGEDGTYYIELSVNDSEADREGVIQVVNDDFGFSWEISIYQRRSDFFELFTSLFEYGPEGGTAQVELNTNVDYSYTVGGDWIVDEGALSFTIGKNTSDQERECTIVFEAVGESFVVTVRQTAPYLIVDTEDVMVDYPGKIFIVACESNVPLTFELPEGGWISHLDGAPAGECAFEVSENTDYEIRSGVITIAAEDFGLSQSISVFQKGMPDPFTVVKRDHYVGPCGGNLEVLHSECNDVKVTMEDYPWIRELPALQTATKVVFYLETLYDDDTREALVSLTGGGITHEIFIYQNPPKLSLATDNKYVSAEGGSFNIKAVTNFSPEFYYDDDWVSAVMNDAGDGLIFTVAPNNTGQERTTVVRIGILELNFFKSVTITQEANDMIQITPPSCVISSDGGDLFITVEANVDYGYVVNDNWLSCSSTGEDGVYRIHVQNNPTTTDRTSEIAFSGGEAHAAVTVKQYGIRNPDYYYSSDFSRNGQITKLQTATQGSGVPLVLMGDAFSDRLIEEGTYAAVMDRAIEAFFAIEPYASFREMFDIYMIDVVSLNEVYADDAVTALSTRFESGSVVSGDASTVYGFAGTIDSRKKGEMLVIVIMNAERYGGTTYLKYHLESSYDYGSGQAISYIPLCTSPEQFAAVLQHEAGGHGFGKLADEYYYSSQGTIPATTAVTYQAYQTVGFYKNVDFTSDPTRVLWSAFLTDERYQYDGLGVFEGAFSYPFGVYRPTQESMMYHNEGPFNAPSREAIYYRLHKLAYGNNWTYDREEFVEYDAINRGSAPDDGDDGDDDDGGEDGDGGAKRTAGAKGALPPLPPPVLVGH